MERLTKDQIQELPIYEGISLENIVVVTKEEEAIITIVSIFQCIGPSADYCG